MELVKVNEIVNRSYNGSETSDEVTNITYSVVENGTNIGSASIADGYFTMSVHMPGVPVSEIVEKVKTLLL